MKELHIPVTSEHLFATQCRNRRNIIKWSANSVKSCKKTALLVLKHLLTSDSRMRNIVQKNFFFYNSGARFTCYWMGINVFWDVSQLRHVQENINPTKLDIASHFTAAVTSTQLYKFRLQVNIIRNWACTWNTGWDPVRQETNGLCAEHVAYSCTFLHLEILSRKFKIYWNITRITRTLYEDVCTFMTIIFNIPLLIMGTISDRIVEKQNTHCVLE